MTGRDARKVDPAQAHVLDAPERERWLRGGELLAVDESPEMLEHLRDHLAGCDRAQALLIMGNRVPRPDGCADRVLAVNLLHEVRGESALTEMRRLLAPGGFILVIDWERGRERDSGPPDRCSTPPQRPPRSCAPRV